MYHCASAAALLASASELISDTRVLLLITFDSSALLSSQQEAIWIRSLLDGIGFKQIEPTTINCDNNSAINLSEDPSLHPHVKHIDIKYHFIRERVQLNEINVSYINTKDNIADAFTKALAAPTFERLRGFMGLKQVPAQP